MLLIILKIIIIRINLNIIPKLYARRLTRMLTLLSLFSLFVKTTSSITDCGLGKSLFTITNLAFFPDPPTPNTNATLRLGYSVAPPTQVQGGTATYAIKYSFIPLTPTIEDLCTQTTCPIVPGTYTQESTSLFPNANGKIDITTTWKDLTGTQLLCYKITTKV